MSLRGPRRWQDLRFPAAGINPPGAASDPADTYGADAKLLEFDIHAPLVDYGSNSLYGDDDR